MALAKNMLKKALICFGSIVLSIVIYFSFGGITDYLSSVLGYSLNDNQKAEVLSQVPEEFRNNYFFSSFGMGTCESLKGDVCITFVFVDDDLSSWKTEETDIFKTEVQKVFEQIKSDATEKGVELNLTAVYKNAESSGELSIGDFSRWVKNAVSSAELPQYSKLSAQLEEEYGVDNAPVVFCVNREGRSFAKTSTAASSTEFVVLYDGVSSFYHELCHVFGAVDFYFPEEVETLAETHLPESIMNAETGKIDDLTAYLIGWTDVLSEAAQKFLTATNHLTEEAMDEYHSDETYTGYVQNKRIGNVIYTGNLIDGILNGEGRQEEDGCVWQGNFKNGVLDGYGTYTDVCGDVYEGDFVDGEKQGNGTYTWADGDVYEGQFKNGIMHGQGQLTWNDSTYYVGDFVEGERTGNGRETWDDGSIYVGEFKNGKFNGHGTYTDKFGRTATGTWRDGEFVG